MCAHTHTEVIIAFTVISQYNLSVTSSFTHLAWQQLQAHKCAGILKKNGPIHRKRVLINRGVQVDETKCEVFLLLINPLVPKVNSFNAQCASEIAI
jgi:hypothetical protein